MPHQNAAFVKIRGKQWGVGSTVEVGTKLMRLLLDFDRWNKFAVAACSGYAVVDSQKEQLHVRFQ